MDTFELLDELMKKDPEEIDYAVFHLMIKKKLDSGKVLGLYLRAIEHDKEDLKDRLTESNTTILDLMLHLVPPASKKKSVLEGVRNAIHRALYNLNISKQFNLASWNEKYGYDEEKDRELSWYWREHRND